MPSNTENTTKAIQKCKVTPEVSNLDLKVTFKFFFLWEDYETNEFHQSQKTEMNPKDTGTWVRVLEVLLTEAASSKTDML